MSDETRDERFKAKGRVLADLDSSTSQISSTSRYIGYGLAVLVFSLYNESSEASGTLLGEYKTSILLASFFGVCTVVLDYLQNVFSYKSSASLMEKAKIDDNHSWKYPSECRWRKWRFGAFYGKQAFAMIGVAILLSTFVRAIIPL